MIGLLLLPLLAFTPTKWQLEKEEDGIKVYLGNANDTKFKQFKVEAFVDAKPHDIARAVVDLENNYKWFNNVKKAKLIKQVSNNEFLFKQVIEVPFPFKNRETVQRCRIDLRKDGTARIDLDDENTAAPADDEYVRMPMAVGYWNLTHKNGGTWVEYSFLTDPGGNIPAWLANEFIVDSPFKTIKNLRAYLKN